MLGWIRRGEGVLQTIANSRQLRLQIESLEQAEATFTDALRAMLTQYGVVPSGGFIDLLEAAEAFVRAAREAAEKAPSSQCRAAGTVARGSANR